MFLKILSNSLAHMMLWCVWGNNLHWVQSAVQNSNDWLCCKFPMKVGWWKLDWWYHEWHHTLESSDSGGTEEPIRHWQSQHITPDHHAASCEVSLITVLIFVYTEYDPLIWLLLGWLMFLLSLRVPSNCQRDFNLLAFDPDGDEVKCRYGNTLLSECNPCTPPSVLSLSSVSNYY